MPKSTSVIVHIEDLWEQFIDEVQKQNPDCVVFDDDSVVITSPAGKKAVNVILDFDLEED